MYYYCEHFSREKTNNENKQNENSSTLELALLKYFSIYISRYLEFHRQAQIRNLIMLASQLKLPS